jgi:DNA-binding response OmpR family regulator
MTAARATVVVIEDDPTIAELVRLYCTREAWVVHHCTDGTAGLQAVAETGADLVVLDVGLPGALDGFAVCRQLVDRGVPVVMLTARDDEVDRVLGLELGADDYVTKPFSPRELVARCRAVLRRVTRVAPMPGVVGPGPQPAGPEPAGSVPAVSVLEDLGVHPPVRSPTPEPVHSGQASGGQGSPALVHHGDLVVDQARHEVRRGDERIDLTAREFALLAHLVGNRGLVLTRRQLLDAVWGYDWVGDERTVDVHVAQLRRKLGTGLPLVTIRGVGYRMD